MGTERQKQLSLGADSQCLGWMSRWLRILRAGAGRDTGLAHRSCQHSRTEKEQKPPPVLPDKPRDLGNWRPKCVLKSSQFFPEWADAQPWEEGEKEEEELQRPAEPEPELRNPLRVQL